MTAKEFKKLKKGDEVYVPADDDERTYSVLKTDRMGRIEMQELQYKINYPGLWMEEYETFDDAMEALQQHREEDIDCYATSNDIESEPKGKPFWMHFTDVEIDF